MTPSVKGRRPYRSDIRDEQARRSRRRMLDAATRLFSEQGYAHTSIRQVAQEAGVSPDLVFHVFATKRELLKEVIDSGIGGDDQDVALLEREGPRAMRDEPDQRRQIAFLAAGIRDQLARVGPLDAVLRGAAAVDPDLAALRTDIQGRQRREAMTTVAGWIADRGDFAGGQSVEDAAATLWTLTSPEVHHLVVEVWGWSPERYAGWLADTLAAALLGPPLPRAHLIPESPPAAP